MGEQRYAEYQLSQDPKFTEIGRFAQRFELPRETARQVFEMRKSAEEQHNSLLANAALSENQKAAALYRIGTKTENSLRELLGKEFYEAYTGNGGASSWIKQNPRK